MNIYFFIGTTAELIRIAPVINELNKQKINFKIITSGQVKVHFEELTGFAGRLKPDIALEEKTNRSSLIIFAMWMIKTFINGFFRLHKEFKGINKKDTVFVICGDPVSTSIGGLIAFMHGLKIVHIESGDLSFNLMEPFPEEICRHINLRLADILFPPGKWAENNLKNIQKIKINTHYNSLLETFLWAIKQKTAPVKRLLNKKYYVLILHRQEHVYFRSGWSRETLRQVIENADPGLTCVLFNYPPTVRMIKSIKFNSGKISDKILIMSPLKYPNFLNLMKNSEFIATDGATNQFEAYLMGVPCLLLRDRTEQIEGIGENAVLYSSDEKILKNFLNNYKKFRRKPVKPKIKPSKIIVEYLKRLV